MAAWDLRAPRRRASRRVGSVSGGTALVGATEPRPSQAILVVHSDAARCREIQLALGGSWPVDVAPGGHAALRCARRRPPGVIVADVELLRRADWRLLRILRRDAATAAAAVVAMVPPGDTELRTASLAAGAEDCLVEPVSARELQSRLSKTIELAALRARSEAESSVPQLVFAHAPTPIAVLRGDELKFSLINEAAFEAFGRGAMIGKTLAEVLPELAEKGCDDVLRRVMRTGEPYVGEQIALGRDSAATNVTYWTFMCAPLEAEPGGEPSAVIVFSPVAEPMVSALELRRLAAEAETASRAKDQFIATLGHELRNPLATIGKSLELMRLGGTNVREQAIIERQVGHMVRLVDDLMDVSRIVAGKLTLNTQRLELAEIVQRAAEVSAPLIEAKRQRLDVDVPMRLCADIDQDRMIQALSNLLDNAAKYSPEGSRITVTGRRHGDVLRLSIRDEGVGIDPDVLEHVFEPFAQQRETKYRAEAGLGLGLAIVRSIVRMHGGDVRAHSEGAGKGTEFVIEIAACV
jgi:nitrogen-specific signal transduction histidine kinase